METKTNHDYTRRNRFTGESIELTKEEAQKHDAIFVAEVEATLEDKELGTGASKHWETINRGTTPKPNIATNHGPDPPFCIKGVPLL